MYAAHGHMCICSHTYIYAANAACMYACILRCMRMYLIYAYVKTREMCEYMWINAYKYMLICVNIRIWIYVNMCEYMLWEHTNICLHAWCTSVCVCILANHFTQFMHIYARKLRRIHAHKYCRITQYVHLRKIHAEAMYKQYVHVYTNACIFKCCTFECAYIQKMHIFTCVCVCARACVIKLEWWQGWSVWGGETCSIYSCCCKCWSWLCKPAMHAAVSPTSICVYECIFTHIHVCVCVCVYRHTHKQMEGSERRRV